ANALWFLGYPDAALSDVEQAIKHARETRQAATLMYSLTMTSFALIHCGNYGSAKMLSDELISLGDEKGASVWKAFGMILQGWLFGVDGEGPGVIKLNRVGFSSHRTGGGELPPAVFTVHSGKGSRRCRRIRSRLAVHY